MAELSAEQRSRLSGGVFAIPERRAYPLTDAAHARNALARVAQHGTPDEKQRVRAAVQARCPEIGKEGHMSLVSKIAGTIRQSSFAPFEELYKEADVEELLPRCPVVLDALSKIASKGVGPRMSLEGAVKLATARRLDVVQVMPTQYGYLVKWAAAPDGVQPQQQELSVPQAQQTLPPEMLQTADAQGVATVTGVEAEPDPLEEHPQSTEGFGLYKVYELGTGKEQVGFVIPSLFDPRSGQSTPTKLFVNGTAFCMQPDIAGVLIGVSYNLPTGPSEPRGMGIFYKTDGKGIIATIPFNVMTSVTVEGRQYYSAQTPEGMEVQIVPSDGLQRPTATSPTEIAMPIDYNWLPLDNQIQLQGAQGADPMQQAKQASVSTRAIIRAWTDGHGAVQGVNLSGPVFAKVGSGVHDPAGALFMLAAAGMPQNLALAVMDKAASTGQPLEMYGLRSLSPEPAIMKEALADAMADLAITARRIPEAPCLLKEAMAIELHKEAKALVGPDSLDTLLSIGFINQENVQDFVDAIPDLEDTASKLASLVFAAQLGLQSVPKEAAVRAMDSLERVIVGLRALRPHRM